MMQGSSLKSRLKKYRAPSPPRSRSNKVKTFCFAVCCAACCAFQGIVEVFVLAAQARSILYYKPVSVGPGKGYTMTSHLRIGCLLTHSLIDGVDRIKNNLSEFFKESLFNKIHSFTERYLFLYSNVVLLNEIVNKYHI